MKNKLQRVLAYYRLHPKRFWVLGIIIVLVVFGLVSGGPKEEYTVIPVERKDLTETVLATGQIVSSTDLSLSFQKSDVVRSINVAVGSKVVRGQVLASLDNRDEYAALRSAQANYQKVVDGATTEEVAVAEAAVAAAEVDLATTRSVQNTLVENARRDMLNTDLTPALVSGTTTTAPTVTGKYAGEEGEYRITVNLTSGDGFVAFSGVESGTASISTTTPVPLGTKGLYIQFPSTYASYPGNVWKVSLPNTASASYLVDYNAYQNALQTRDSVIAQKESTLLQRKADLNLKKAAARGADVEVAEAEVLKAQVTYDNTILRAPASGTIVSVDTKIGELVQPQGVVMVLQDVGNIYVEAKINESNIAKISLGAPVEMTLDAFGPSRIFTGEIVHIDPSATIDDGVVNYKINVSINQDTEALVRPGMNANIVITASKTAGVIAIPEAAVTKEDGKTFVSVLTNGSKKMRHAQKQEVILGKRGDGNLVEITEGLSEGMHIIFTQ